MEINVRKARPGDFGLIGRLLNEILRQHRDGRPDLFEVGENLGKYDREHFEALLKDPGCVVFTAECDGEPAGYLICKIISERPSTVLKAIKTLYLDDLCVDKSRRGIGVGRALMAAAESYARENNFHNITLNVWEFNASARGFYESLGYTTQRREMEKAL